jgi:hypothetical protein
MTPRTKILGRVLVLAAITSLAGAAVAEASPSRATQQTHLVGRIASLSTTGFTINGKTLTASSAQLARLTEGQCVEVKTRRSQGALKVVRIEREDRCAPLTTTTTSDDPAQHDAGDDHGNRGTDDPPSHDAGDDHGRHGDDR